MSAGETASNIEGVGKTRLQRNALSLAGIVASTLAFIAPAASFFFGFAVIVQGAGVAAVLTILVAMVTILFLPNTVAQFSRFTPSAGSCVTFTGKAFGPAVGAAVAVFTNFGFVVLASAFLAGAGAWFAETLKTFSAISVSWAVIAVLISLATGWLVARVTRTEGTVFSA
jgi:amino acid transporter